LPDVSKYEFTIQELAEILVREAGLTEGRWQIGMNFTVTSGAMGPDANNVFPTLLAGVDKVNIVRVADGAETTSLTIDVASLKKKSKK